jgi:hypothetical protein
MRQILSDLSNFDVLDETSGLHSAGLNQEWYGDWWRRRAGCGPATFSNAVLYTSAASAVLNGKERRVWTRTDGVRLMDEVWGHVTPGMAGLNTTGMMREGARSFAHSLGVDLNVDVLDVPSNRQNRPSEKEAAAFIISALRRDSPPAFLNLCNGCEARLDAWHWVTAVGIMPGEAGGSLLEVLDNGETFSIQLGAWLSTTNKGGGFVAFGDELSLLGGLAPVV